MNCKYCGNPVHKEIDHEFAYCKECDVALEMDEISSGNVFIHTHYLKIICYTSEETIEGAVVNGNGVVDIYLNGKCFSSGLTFVDKYNPVDSVDTMVGTLRAIGHEVKLEWVIDHRQVYDYTWADSERSGE